MRPEPGLGFDGGISVGPPLGISRCVPCTASPNDVLGLGPVNADLQFVAASYTKDDDHEHYFLEVRFEAKVNHHEGMEPHWAFAVTGVGTKGNQGLLLSASTLTYQGWLDERHGRPVGIRISFSGYETSEDGALVSSVQSEDYYFLSFADC